MDEGPHAADASLVSEFHAALLTGDLGRLAPLTDRLFQGANAVLELREEEMEWQGRTPATFGLSGSPAPCKLRDPRCAGLLTPL